MDSNEFVFVAAIKEEEADDEQNLEYNNVINHELSETGFKLGEIFSSPMNQLSLVCTHCVFSSKSLAEFSIHAEKHLINVLSTKVEPTLGTDESGTIEESKQDVAKSNDPERTSGTPTLKETSDHPADNREPLIGTNLTAQAFAETASCDDIVGGSLEETEYEIDSDDEQAASASENEIIGDESNAKSKFKCDRCGKAFDKAVSLRMHRNYHTLSPNYGCSICGRKFPYISLLQSHMKLHNLSFLNVKGRKIECRFCQQGLASYSRVQIHMESVHKLSIESANEQTARTFECDKCDRSLESYLQLQLHAVEHRPKECTCSTCNRQFHFEFQLELHQRSHQYSYTELTDTKLECDKCKAIFQSFPDVQKHFKKMHAAGFRCPICERRFHKKYNMTKHMETHSGHKKHICHLCGNYYQGMDSLNAHLRRQHGHAKAVKQVFTCDICKNKFNKSYRVYHMRTHNNIRPFKCGECDKTFSSPSGLNRHSRSHSDERKYQCNLCPKSYKISDKLLIHRRTHTGQYIYNCDVCHVGFSEKRSLKRHIELRKCIPRVDNE